MTNGQNVCLLWLEDNKDRERKQCVYRKENINFKCLKYRPFISLLHKPEMSFH